MDSRDTWNAIRVISVVIGTIFTAAVLIMALVFAGMQIFPGEGHDCIRKHQEIVQGRGMDEKVVTICDEYRR